MENEEKKGFWEQVKAFFAKYMYSREEGLKSGLAAPALLGALGLFMGGIRGAGIGAVIGGVLTPVVQPILDKILAFLGVHIKADVPGGNPTIRKIPIGESQDPLESQAAPVTRKDLSVENATIKAPALRNIRLPQSHIAQNMALRKEAINEAVKLTDLEATTGTATKAMVKEHLDRLWKKVYTQEKQVADFVATLDRYARDRDTYHQSGGERDQLVTAIVTHSGKSKDEVEKLVPTLPKLPTDYARYIADAGTIRRHKYFLKRYQLQYEQEKAQGKLAKEFEGKAWDDLDPLMRLSYGYNKANEEVALTRKDIDVSQLPPKYTNSLPGLWKEGERLGVNQLSAPDFEHLDATNGPTWDTPSFYMQKNYAAVCISGLRRNPDSGAEQGRQYVMPAMRGRTYISDQVRIFAEVARRHIETDRVGDSKAYAEYGKIIEYCDACERRRYIADEITEMNAPVKKLEEFRATTLEKSKAEVDTFLSTTLKEINEAIRTPQTKEQAPAPIDISKAQPQGNPIADLAAMVEKLVKFPMSDASLENNLSPVLGMAKGRIPVLGGIAA